MRRPSKSGTEKRLTEFLIKAPDAVLAGSVGGPLLGLLSAITEKSITEDHVESFSRFWLSSGDVPQPRAAVEASIVASRLAHTGRRDLAAITALCLLRAVWASIHGAEPPPVAAVEMADSARRLFLGYADDLWADAQGLEADSLAALNASGGHYSTYRVMSLRLMEILSLLALADSSRSEEIGLWLSRFVTTNPGAFQPLSDRWALSLIPASILLGKEHRDVAAQQLAWTASWICDQYENGLGLAPPGADPRQEIDYFFGASLEHVTQPRRRLSYLATVVVDLAAALEFPTVYDEARNDFLAVDVGLTVPLPRDDDAQYQVSRAALPLDTSPKYAERWSEGSDWRMAPHHEDDLRRYYLGRIDRLWDHLAICCVTRDRHWVAAIRALALATAKADGASD